jgi:hypothetical protein
MFTDDLEAPSVALAASIAGVATATTTTATTAAVRPLFRFVDAESAAVEVSAVHGLHGHLGLGAGTHGDEREAARLAGHAISHEVNVNDLAACSERIAQRILGRVKSEISDIETIGHFTISLLQSGRILWCA